MNKKLTEHIHKYRRMNLTVNPDKAPFIVFKCILPACPHYIRKDLAEGKICLCNRCNEPMVLTRAAMLLAKPHCVDCTKPKKKEEIDAIADFLKRHNV